MDVRECTEKNRIKNNSCYVEYRFLFRAFFSLEEARFKNVLASKQNNRRSSYKKLNRWVPPGGKIDSHETPDEAAIRECLEETGVNIELLGVRAPVDGGLVAPQGIQLNPIIPNERDHIDLIYFAQPIDNEILKISEREAADIGWFSYEALFSLNTFPSILK